MRKRSQRSARIVLWLAGVAIGGCYIQPAPGYGPPPAPGPTSGPQPPQPQPQPQHQPPGHQPPEHQPPATGYPHPQQVRIEEIRDETGKIYQVQQGVQGSPAVVGCADGQREAFVDAGAFPAIAGCLATWDGTQSLRAQRTGGSCGDDLGPCSTPADACAPGWHLCGASGALADLRQVTGEQCETAGGGRFSAAVSHCAAQSGCQYDHAATAHYACFARGWCSEPVCCGSDCGQFGACRDGVWKGLTHIPVGTDQGCGAVQSRRAGGLLCCRG